MIGVSIGPGLRVLIRMPRSLNSWVPGAGVGAHRRLGGAVGAVAVDALGAGDRADQDDRASVAQEWQRLLRGEQRRPGVQVEGLVEVLLGDVPELLRLDPTGVGDQDVQLALLLQHRLEQAVEVGGAGSVAPHGGHVVADQCLRLGQLGLPPAGDEDVRALFREPLRDGQADAARPAGDDGNLSVQSRHGETFAVAVSGRMT